MKYFVALVIGIILCFGVFKLVPKASQQHVQNTKLQVVTSFYPVYFFASQIGGDKADVLNITPSGAEPHDYEPTAQDIARIEKSNLVVLNGAHLEAWGENIKNNLSNKSVIIVSASEGLATKDIEEEGKKIQDPHVWLSPPLAKDQVENILQGFIQADPKNKDYYTKNAQNLKEQLTQLDVHYRQAFASCKRKDFITSHAAFGYLASTYGLTQVSISGISPDEEPSLKQLTRISEFAKKNQVQYIFFESLVSPKLSETIAHEVGAKTLVLDPIEGVSEKDINSGKNYFNIMDSNLTNLRTALECK